MGFQRDSAHSNWGRTSVPWFPLQPKSSFGIGNTVFYTHFTAYHPYTHFGKDMDAEVIEAFNSKSRYLDALLNIDNTYFDGILTTWSIKFTHQNFS